nr:MAG: hypothetical protein [Pigeon-associated tombus-like virus]
MTERLFLDRVVVPSFPYPLNPQSLLNLVAPRTRPPQARFVTAITISYHPNVSTATPGECCIAAALDALPDLRACQAATWKATGPVWRKLSLVIPRQSANLQKWSTQDTACLQLSAHGLSGTVTITCTVVAVTNGSLPRPPNALCDLSSLDAKVALFGPKLDGFSFVSCIPPAPQPVWTGSGNCMNVSFLNGTGNVKSNLYICSPSNKPYVVVRYGFGSNFQYRYNSKNSNRSWRSNSYVIREFNNNTTSNSVGANYYASWTTIYGSTSWWAEIVPNSTYYQVNGGMTWYHPCTHLLLYYDYGNTDIEAQGFAPDVGVFPGDILPDPLPGANPNAAYSLVLNEQQPQLTFDPDWYGTETEAQQQQLENERAQLERNKRGALFWKQMRDELRLSHAKSAVDVSGEDTRKVPENLHAQSADLFLDS